MHSQVSKWLLTENMYNRHFQIIFYPKCWF